MADSLNQFLQELPTPRILSMDALREREARYRLDCRQLRRESGVDARYAAADLRQIGGELPEGYRLLACELEKLLEDPKLIAVGGPRGTGKTWLACALVNAACDLHRPAMYRTTVEYFQTIKDAFGRGGEEPERVRMRFVRPELLVLDEVQLRDQDRAWQDAQLTELIDKRYRQCRATVLLSNLSAAELCDNLGPSIWRRLIEEGGAIDADWTRIQTILKKGAA